MFYSDNISKHKLSPTDLSLSSYKNVPTEPIGKITLIANYQGVSKSLDLHVIKDSAHLIMGRDWLKVLQVEISFNAEKLLTTTDAVKGKNFFEKLTNELIREYPKVFTDQLVQYKSKIVKLLLKENSIPKYIKPRPLPFTLKI